MFHLIVVRFLVVLTFFCSLFTAVVACQLSAQIAVKMYFTICLGTLALFFSLCVSFGFYFYLLFVDLFLLLHTHTHTHSTGWHIWPFIWQANAAALHFVASTGHLKFMPCHIKKQLKSRQTPDEPRERMSERESESWHEPESKQAKPLKTRCKRKRKSRHEANKNTIANGASG